MAEENSGAGNLAVTPQSQITIVTAGNVASLAGFKEGDDWEIFEERLEQYLLANLVEEDRKVSVLLTLISEGVYKTLRHLCDPLKPKEKSYVALIEILSGQYKKRLSLYRHRIRLENLKQNQNETVNQWYVKIKNITSQCGFEGDMLKERVKDKFVAGMYAGKIQNRLCEESPTKSLEDLLEIALNKEAAMQEAGKQEVEVDKLHSRWRNVKKVKAGEKNKEVVEKKTETVEPKCFHCGKTNHNFKFCKYKSFTCKKCGKKGHILAACSGNVGTHFVEDCTESENIGHEQLTLFNLESVDYVYVKPIILKILINNLSLDSHLDTGSGVSCIPIKIVKEKLSDIVLNKSRVKLVTYSGEVMAPEGEIEVEVNIQGVVKNCTMFVVKKATKILLGRDIINTFNLISIRKPKIDNFTVECTDEVANLMNNFPDLFKNKLGTYNEGKVHLELQENVRPIFHKPKPIPFAFREKVLSELDRLEKEGVIAKVGNADWGTPIVPVMKANGKDVRVCANYKITVNKYLKDVNHPLPRIEDIFAALQGGKKFTKLDFLNAYNQLVLDDETSNLLTWSTPYGIYKVFRLPYGTKPACSIFQSIVEKVLQGCRGTVNFLDDVVVTGKTDKEHMENLREVLKRLSNAGFKLNVKKCEFFKDCIYYLGHKISERGLERDNSKIKAILESPRPKNVTEVRAFCGMINYYSKFIPNLSGRLKPLYDLVGGNKSFSWNKSCEDAFNWAKEQLVSDSILVHYDPEKPIRLACDSSQYGIGAVLMHVMSDGSEKPICYISRVLSKAEKNYSMIMKEALAIYWAVSKLYQYLIGQKFEILCDHKPLQALFGEYRSLPQMAAGRIQRWTLFLANFDYTFKYIRGKDNCKADALSRLPMSNTNNITGAPEELDSELDYVNFIENSTIVDLLKVRSETRHDPVLGSIFNYIRYGFPKTTDNDLLKPYFIRRHELNIDKGVIMWGYRVVIPTKLRENLLNELHSTHEGIVKMKCNARAYFWWPSLDSDIEAKVNNCKSCTSVRQDPPKAKLINTEKTNYFYERVHADFLGPFNNKMILIIIDSYSKWPEAFIMRTIDSKSTIEKFRECFARFGLPKVVVTDNGPQFTSGEFSQFLSTNGIKHVTAPPFHPATNGLAENTVKSIKLSLRKCLLDPLNRNVSFETLVNRYLFNYRNSIHVTTGSRPSDLIFKRKVKTRLDLLLYKDRDIENKLEKRITNFKGQREDKFKVGDRVWCRDYRNPNKKGWVEGVIDEVLGDRVFLCKLENEGLVWKRHLDQIIRNNSDKTEYDDVNESIVNRHNIPIGDKNMTINMDDSVIIENNAESSDSSSNSNSVKLDDHEIDNVVKNSPNLSETIVNENESNKKTDAQISDTCVLPVKENVSVSPSHESNMNLRPKRQIKPPDRLNL